MSTTDNPFEAEARRVKATRLAGLVSVIDPACTADDVAGWDDDTWQRLETAAGTRPASPATRQLVVSMMRTAERVARDRIADSAFAELRTGTPVDPFDGL